MILFNKQYRAEARRERSTAEKFKREKKKYIIQYGANFSTVASDLLKRETHNVSKPKHWWHNENRLCKVQKQYKQLNNNNLILALKGDSHRFTLTSEDPVANKWWMGLISHTLFSLFEKSREKNKDWLRS